MIALDTNVLARFITGDDPAQERAVLRLLASSDATFFVGDVALVELAWVLGDSYGFSREELACALESLVSRADLVFEDRVRVRRAVKHLAEGGDFADFVILARAQAEGCTALASFDRELKKRFSDFVVLPK